MLLLAACGSSDSDSSATSSSTDTTEASPQGGGATANEQDKTGKGSGQDKQAGEDTDKSGGGSSGSSAAPAKLRVSGGGSTPFLAKGGDNSIQEFGGEADEAELTEAAEELHGYLVARSGEEWEKACSYFGKDEISQLEALGSQSPQLKGKGCAAVVEALSGPVPPSVRQEVTQVDAASLRVDGEEAFLLYHGMGNGEKFDFFIRMIDEDGSWKVAGLEPSVFP
jgi:hypothetical protein